LVGTTVGGRYKIESLLGTGGMCSVYRATDGKEKKSVALKVLPAASAQDAELARRFQREITTGRRIDHPNVVAIWDAGDLPDGGRFLVMELLEGHSLSHALHAGRMPAPRALGIARQMLVGLGKAHALGIAHRDIKPDNIFLVGDTVKLLDFGIASNERAAEKLTAAGVAFGTPEYISPEMAMGLPTDARSDIYSVGVVLFQMLSGRLPFVDSDPKALLRAHAHEAAPSLTAVVPDAHIPEALAKIVARALEKLPEDRYQSAAAMQGALDAIVAADRAAREAKARKRRLTFATLFLLALAAGTTAFWLSRQDRTALETGATCADRKAALVEQRAKANQTLLPALRRARDRGRANDCMQKELRSLIHDLER